MSWQLLSRFLDSEHFNKDPSLTVAYLARYAEHVGIHYALCSKLRTFSYEEIEFFLPQLCHLVVSVDNESMALEEFVVDLCEESVGGALLTFWLFQTYLHDLSAQPASEAFRTCRRVYNRVQSIVFGATDAVRRDRIHENVLSVTVLSSLVMASIGMPMLAQAAMPLAVAQARRPRPMEDDVPDMASVQKLGRSHTVTGNTTTSRRAGSSTSEAKDPARRKTRRPVALQSSDITLSRTQPSSPRLAASPRLMELRDPPTHRHSLAVMTQGPDDSLDTMSLPEHRKASVGNRHGPLSPGVPRRPSELSRRHSTAPRNMAPSTMSREHKTRLLRQNYFRSEMQFLTALEGISSRLVAVPKPARLSALRAELALVGQDLPAEVDIPLICPPTLVDGTASKSRHHRIVRLNPAEATSLNSAAKVPYLLMLEIIHDDFDFDPDSEQNEQLLAALLSDKGKKQRRLFDTSDAARAELERMQSPRDRGRDDSVFEPTLGDLSSPALLRGPEHRPNGSNSPRAGASMPPRLSSGVSTLSSSASIATPRTSEGPTTRASTPGARPSGYGKGQAPDQAEVSALATHMRTAAHMLAQLEISATKRPKAEVASIKAKIIASMQSLEEQSFLSDDALASSNFDTMIAKAGTAAANAEPDDFTEGELEADTDPTLTGGRGAARMENDMKTGGVERKGDRDDPSAATVGEAWEQKKERIRRSSPYGWVKGWDLLSVIVKTGDDLRQEAFACQLINTCSRIWQERGIDVWVKDMRILVTGGSSGILETITNAISLHSLKRSLTLASIAANPNVRTRPIATLKDHYLKTFGAADSPAYSNAIDDFAQSLAAYSIICYILQLKDRHNGNILIDAEGHVIHIDFGFMLSNSPGSIGFEAAPFKLTFEYVELLGGIDSTAFLRFKDLLKDAFQALRRDAERIVMLVELMGKESRMACFGSGLPSVVAALRGRFVLEKSEDQAKEFVDNLIEKSVGSYFTRLYDTFQYRTQGIY
ncbi:Phosphatidylinositol 4-kinase pik1alpha (PI4-kinase)(PtdIns-4-kinase) [Oleoguttula sp. CCFEE 5521]